MTSSKESRFLNLVERVHACQKCPRMNGSARVLGLGCGPLDAEVMFVGEAPGRLGADGSHLPFHGDKSGHNFESLIDQVGITRYEVFVTNSVLCNPRNAAGNNATPTPHEIANCSVFLREQIEIVDPKFVVTLGATALKGCSLVAAHDLNLRESVRTKTPWFGRALIPVYHPGQRAMVHRSFANQLADYQFIAELARRSLNKKRTSLFAKKQRNLSVRSGKPAKVVRKLLERKPEGMSYFSLHKLYFLSEIVHMDAIGERLTNAYVIRQKDGPYFVDLHIAKLSATIPGLRVEQRGGSTWLSVDPQLEFVENEVCANLSTREIESIEHTVARYGTFTDAALKRAVYLSKPMRAVLRKERKLKLNLFNTAVLPYKERGYNP